MRVGVDRDDAAPEDELGAVLLVPPNLRLVAVLPEALRQRRPLVRRERLLADEPDRPVGVGVADAVADGVAGHAAADDEIAIGTHLVILPGGEVLRAGGGTRTHGTRFTKPVLCQLSYSGTTSS